MPDQRAYQPPQLAEYVITALGEEHVVACCLLEGVAFSKLREEWGQPPHPPRREDWLRHHVRSSPDNNLVALSDGKVIGFSLTHHWGSLGWLGPIVVDPQRQGLGLGRELIRRSVAILERLNCQSIALETWPHHNLNVALYIKCGFRPGELIFVLEKRASEAKTHFAGQWLSHVSQPESWLDRLSALSGKVVPGLDYRPMMRYTLECRLGDVAFWERDGEAVSAAVVHLESYSQVPSPDYAAVELLLIQPGSETHLDDFLLQLEGWAASIGRSSVRLSVPGRHAGALYHLLQERGYRLNKTRLRMAVREQDVPAERVNFLSYAI
jgi:ribosomal protein S18 acetylase RimI-like enzyme